MVTCRTCSQLLSESRLRRGAKYCSDRCRFDNAKKKYRQVNPKTGLPKDVAGTINRLLVAIDLLRKGFEVFPALGQGFSTGFAVRGGGRLIRIGVTSAKISPTGNPLYSGNIEKRFEIVALVFTDNRIEYRPELPAFPPTYSGSRE